MTIQIPTAFLRTQAPRGAEPLAQLAAFVWQALSGTRRPQRTDDPLAGAAELWALADKYDAVDPRLASDLRHAAQRRQCAAAGH